MKSRQAVILIVLILLAIGGTIAASHALGVRVWLEGGEACMGRNGHTAERCFLRRKLNLSEAQQEKFDEQQRAFCEETAELRSRIHSDREKLASLLMEATVAREKLKSRIADLSAHQNELQLKVVDHMLKLKEVLTPEQQEEFFSMIGERMCPGATRGHHGAGPHGGNCGREGRR